VSPAAVWARAASAPTLPPGEVHVWRIDLDVRLEQAGALAATLSDDERARATRFRFERHRARWITARGTLRALLADYVGCAPASLTLGAEADGKPFLHDGSARSPLCFNLAHADGVALVAVAWQRAVGVDIEREAPERVDLAVAQRMFAADEARALAGMPAPLRCRAFYALWTAREAYAKAIGRGLEAMRDSPPAGWTVRQLALGPGYAGAVAVERGAEAVRCWHWEQAAALIRPTL
jgi:4'-phosphopantetheinyl transferase